MTKDEFKEKANFELLGEPEQLINDFVSYWTETSLNGKKMRFEGQKYFDIKRRFATWKKNAKNWDKTDISARFLFRPVDYFFTRVISG